MGFPSSTDHATMSDRLNVQYGSSNSGGQKSGVWPFDDIWNIGTTSRNGVGSRENVPARYLPLRTDSNAASLAQSSGIKQGCNDADSTSQSSQHDTLSIRSFGESFATERSLSRHDSFGAIGSAPFPGANRSAFTGSWRLPANNRLDPLPTTNKAQAWSTFTPACTPTRAIEQPPTVYTKFDRPQDPFLPKQAESAPPLWPGYVTPSPSDEPQYYYSQPGANIPTSLGEFGHTLGRLESGPRSHRSDWTADISPTSISGPRSPLSAAWSETPSQGVVVPQSQPLQLGYDSSFALNGSHQKANYPSQQLSSGSVPVSMRNLNFNTPQTRNIQSPTTMTGYNPPGGGFEYRNAPVYQENVSRSMANAAIYESQPKPNPMADPNYAATKFQDLRIAEPKSTNTYSSKTRDNSLYALPSNKHPAESPFGYVSTPIFNGVDGYQETSLLDNIQSVLLYEFKTSAKTNKWELRWIYNHVAEFSGDQHGSRFIQTKLETANSDEKERIFQELQPNILPLMTDVFGNYVIQKFFEHGDQTHKKALVQKMRGNILTLSLQMYGCRVVQKALDHVLVDQQAQIVSELEGNVLRCVKDQNGNHVVQKAIERCPPRMIRFIVESFRGQVVQLSANRFGCRVIQRCLEHCDAASKALIMAELMDSIHTMISDAFGNYVVQNIVSKVEGPGKQRVLQIVAHGLERFSRHKFASNVVEKCLEHADDSWRYDFLCILFRDCHHEDESVKMLVGLIKDQYANYVIQKLLDTLCPDDYVMFAEVVRPAVALAKRYGCAHKQTKSMEEKLHKYPQILKNHRASFIRRSSGSRFLIHTQQGVLEPDHDHDSAVSVSTSSEGSANAACTAESNNCCAAHKCRSS